ncbi:MAG TPA: hypothetical protein PLU30_12370 [Verrucomicrobiae bacterium]|nr:hypothetical protein [Verrucomicrobiae bacterium]
MKMTSGRRKGGFRVPFPKGRLWLNRRAGAQLEFIGEDEIAHSL